MQLVFPRLRPQQTLKSFCRHLEKSGYNLHAWRENYYQQEDAITSVLDANGGAGWDLAARMLASRGEWLDAAGGIDWRGGNSSRLSAKEALDHPFLAAPVSRAGQRTVGWIGLESWGPPGAVVRRVPAQVLWLGT